MDPSPVDNQNLLYIKPQSAFSLVTERLSRLQLFFWSLFSLSSTVTNVYPVTPRSVHSVTICEHITVRLHPEITTCGKHESEANQRKLV